MISDASTNIRIPFFKHNACVRGAANDCGYTHKTWGTTAAKAKLRSFAPRPVWRTCYVPDTLGFTQCAHVLCPTNNPAHGVGYGMEKLPGLMEMLHHENEHRVKTGWRGLPLYPNKPPRKSAPGTQDLKWPAL
jgi:hypothetical protein